MELLRQLKMAGCTFGCVYVLIGEYDEAKQEERGDGAHDDEYCVQPEGLGDDATRGRAKWESSPSEKPEGAVHAPE